MAESNRWSKITSAIGRAVSPKASPTFQRANKRCDQKSCTLSPCSGSTECSDFFIVKSNSFSFDSNQRPKSTCNRNRNNSGDSKIGSTTNKCNNQNTIQNKKSTEKNCKNSPTNKISIKVSQPEADKSLVTQPADKMAATMSFADWRQTSNENLMKTAENLLDNLEDVAELLTEIDEKYLKSTQDVEVDDARASTLQRFHEGVESARNVVGVLKREKWRLNKREMSVELKMGELEDYKTHLKSDMSSLNQTVDALSMRIIQLENRLVEAQEVQECLEAEVKELKRSLDVANNKCEAFAKEKESMNKELGFLRTHTMETLYVENGLLKNEISVLRDENHKLKELIRNAETHPRPSDDDHLARLTRDFLKELSNLEAEGTVDDNKAIGNHIINQSSS